MPKFSESIRQKKYEKDSHSLSFLSQSLQMVSCAFLWCIIHNAVDCMLSWVGVTRSSLRKKFSSLNELEPPPPFEPDTPVADDDDEVREWWLDDDAATVDMLDLLCYICWRNLACARVCVSCLCFFYRFFLVLFLSIG